MKLYNRNVLDNTPSTALQSSASGKFLIYRGVSYYRQNVVISEKPIRQAMIYRGVSYYQNLELPEKPARKQMTYRGVSYYK